MEGHHPDEGHNVCVDIYDGSTSLNYVNYFFYESFFYEKFFYCVFVFICIVVLFFYFCDKWYCVPFTHSHMKR